MRNLKRALSLALASVMLLGMMVVGTGAASYADVDNQDNKEAIEVVQAVGIMIGDEKGNFNPDQSVTRNEMAVVMANMLNLKVSDFNAASIPFTDVPAWAAPYVAACYADGITSGMSATTYGGSQTVTAAQAGLMMLKALGYFQYQQDFGDSWTLATVKQGSKIELFDGIDAGASEALTRNDVAQLALNTLEATMVEPDGDGGTTIKGDGFEITTGNVKYVDRETSKYDYTRANGKYVDGSEKTLQLCEELFKEDLTKVATGSDNYGRPANKWTYEKEEVGKYAKDADATYTANPKAKDIYSDLGLSETVAVKDITVYVDGNSTNDIVKQEISKTNSEKFKNVRGGVMEVFLNDDKDEVTICYVYNWLGVVTDDTAKKDGDDGIYVAVDGVDYFIKDATGYAEDDVLVVTLGKDSNTVEAEIVGKPATVTGTVSAISGDYDLTVDGTKYYMANSFSTGDGDVVDGIAKKDFKADEDVSYIIYLDANGNILAVAEDEDNSVDDVVYVYSVEVGSVMDGSRVKYAVVAKVVDTDGVVAEYTVSDTYTDKSKADADLNTIEDYKGGFATLNYDKGDDEYTLKDINSDDYDTAKAVKAGVKLNDDDVKAMLDGSKSYYLDKDTVYIFVEQNDDKDDIDSVEVITGGINYTTTAGYFLADGKNVKYVVFTDDSYTADSDDVIYLDNESRNALTSNDYYTFDAYFLGDKSTKEITVATVGGKDVVDNNITKLNGFYKYSEKSDGALKLTPVTDKYVVDVDSWFTATLDDVNNNNLEFTPAKSGSADSAKMSDTVFVDLTDADKASENAYGRNITSASTLERVLDRGYTVTAAIFVNEDGVVENIFITQIEAAK